MNFPDIEDTVDAKGHQINQEPACDKLIITEVKVKHGNEMIYGKVKKLSLNHDIQTPGIYDKNTMLN